MFRFLREFKYVISTSLSITGLTAASIYNRRVNACDSNINTSNTSDINKSWAAFTTPEGQTYFYNTVTGQTTWNLPTGPNSLANPINEPSTSTWPPVSKWDRNWDGREEEAKLSNSNSNEVSHVIVMIRHGEYTTKNINNKRIEALTQTGRDQVAVTGARLAILQNSKIIPSIKTIYWSTMPRTKETFEIIKSKLVSSSSSSSPPPDSTSTDTSTDTDTADEIDYQPCTMIREAAVCYPDPPTKLWNPEKYEFDVEGLQALAGFRTYFHRAEPSETKHYSTVLVTHGNIIRFYIMKVLQLPPEAWLRLNVRNASITIVEIRKNGLVSLKTVGDTGHLKPEHITENTIKITYD